jgi:hypothetical protein
VPTTKEFLIEFQRACDVNPLEPGDPRYMPLYDAEHVQGDDPVYLLRDTIEVHSEQTVQLLSGYRGSGKSTELKRLTNELWANDYVALMFDIEDYLSPGKPVELIDFLFALTGALGEACAKLGVAPDAVDSFWDRTLTFLKRVKFDVAIHGGIPENGVELKLALKDSTEFTKQLRTFMATRVGEVVAEVRASVAAARVALLASYPNTRGVVIIVDSIEHFRGTASTEDAVQQSIERLFGDNSDALHFPKTHMIYTVPPYLRVRVPKVSERFEPGLDLQMLPTVKTHTQDGAPYQAGLDSLVAVVAKRGEWQRFIDEPQLQRVIAASGGHLRDLMRMMQGVLRGVRQKSLERATDEIVSAAIESATRDMLPIADDDAKWLWEIHLNHEFPLPSVAQLPRLSRFLDTHLVLCYRNGREWYDVHPLIVGDIERQVKRLQ